MDESWEEVITSLLQPSNLKLAAPPDALTGVPHLHFSPSFEKEIAMHEVFAKVIKDPRYLSNLDWGEPRSGHPEGTIRAHIAALEASLSARRDRFSESEYWKLRILIHTHDTFKGEAKPGVAITDPQSHASLARSFLEQYCHDPDLLNMVQYHDEGHALWRQFSEKGTYNQERFSKLLSLIQDWNLFLWFAILDGCTEGKERDSLRWFVEEVNKHIQTSVGADLIW
jgi:hypothetical protein